MKGQLWPILMLQMGQAGLFRRRIALILFLRKGLFHLEFSAALVHHAKAVTTSGMKGFSKIAKR
jgi:hypothetical protein